MAQAIEHHVQGCWQAPDGAWWATEPYGCQPIPGWNRFGETPGAVMSRARQVYAELVDAHPDAGVVKVDILESLVSWDEKGTARRLYTRKVGQHPAEDVEVEQASRWAALRAQAAG